MTVPCRGVRCRVGGMRERRRELARLCRCAITRPRWHLALAVLVSAWALASVVGQVGGAPTSPLGVLRVPVDWAGIPVAWLDAVRDWIAARRDLVAGLAVVAGLLWAVTTERAQLPALVGWLAVLVAVEAVGYPNAVRAALATTAIFVGVLALLALPGRRRMVVDRIALLPRHVLRTGATALALSAVVPLIAPGLLLACLVRPYTTRPPRPDPSRPTIPAQARGSRVATRSGVKQVPNR